MGTNQPTNTPAPDWREQHRQARAERRAARGGGEWVIGAILLVIGVLLFAQNMGGFTLNNWWALFILIPALASFAGAWRIFNSSGGSAFAALGPFLVGLLLLGVTATFLFNLNWNFVDWGIIGPVILILLGVVTLLGGVVFRRR